MIPTKNETITISNLIIRDKYFSFDKYLISATVTKFSKHYSSNSPKRNIKTMIPAFLQCQIKYKRKK